MTMTVEPILNEDGLLKAKPATIYVYSGGTIDPLDPDPADIKLADIAHSLALQCRWTGHVTKRYSVAEHCVKASQITEDLETLMHDGSEAYLCDFARPLKQAPGFGELYLKYELVLEQAIAERFGLNPPPMSPATKYADDQMLFREAKVLVPMLGKEMPEPDPGTPQVECWGPEEAEEKFLERFYELGGTE